MDTLRIETHWQIMHRSLPFADGNCSGIIVGTYEHLSCSHCRKHFVLRPKWTVEGIAAFDIVAAEPRFPATRTLPGVWNDGITIPIPVCSGCGEPIPMGQGAVLRRERPVIDNKNDVAIVDEFYCDTCKHLAERGIDPSMPVRDAKRVDA